MSVTRVSIVDYSGALCESCGEWCCVLIHFSVGDEEDQNIIHSVPLCKECWSALFSYIKGLKEL